MTTSIALLALLAPLQFPDAAPAQTLRTGPPNILLIVADDLGVDMVGAYGEAPAPPCTPNIDALAAGGMLFRNAWANPICSPTRSAILTGRHAFRTGVGDLVDPDEPGLTLGELTIPELLTGYASSCTGKWHLGGSLGFLHPNLSGFGHYAGTLHGQIPTYSLWPKVIDGQPLVGFGYATTDTTDDAITALQTMPEPWFLYVAYQAPHAPLHEPCLLYTSPSPRDLSTSRMPSSA